MKILLVASNMVHIKNFHTPYINAFKEKGHDVYVMTSTQDADFEIPFKKSVFSLKNFFLSFKIRKILKREKFDAIYLHTSLSAFWTRFAMWGMKNKPLVVNTVHGYLFSKNDKSFKKKLYLFAERLMRRRTDYIFVMNREDYEIATENKLCQKEVLLINGMGIDSNRIDFTNTKRERNELLSLTYVGEISKRKNQIFLVKALARLENARLTLVGDGDCREELEGLAKKLGVENRLIITGFTKNVREYLLNTDIYVSASRIEGLPFNILEAMGASLPIVASDIKGQRDILPSESLYPLDDEDAFVELVKRTSLEKREYNLEPYIKENILKNNVELYLNLDN